MGPEAKILQVPERLTFYPQNWKVLDILPAKFYLSPEYTHVALVIPKEPGIQAGLTRNFQMMLAAITPDGKITSLAAHVMSLRQQGTLGFVASGTGFMSIYLDSENPAKDYPEHSRKIGELVDKVKEHRDVLLKNSNQEDLEKAAIDIAPALAKFFDLENEVN